MTAPIFTSIVVNSLFLAFVATFCNPTSKIQKVMWAISIFLWAAGFILNLYTVIGVFGWMIHE